MSKLDPEVQHARIEGIAYGATGGLFVAFVAAVAVGISSYQHGIKSAQDCYDASDAYLETLADYERVKKENGWSHPLTEIFSDKMNEASHERENVCGRVVDAPFVIDSYAEPYKIVPNFD